MSDAAALRREILARRKALSDGDLQSKSRLVAERFLKLSGLPANCWKGLRIALYQALPGELSLHRLEERLGAHGAHLLFPRVKERTSKELEFAEAGIEPAWQEGPYGIREPHSDQPACDPAKLDLAFVPGVAFGSQGERLGMGAGYYDRFLARLPGLVRVVLAFDFQLFDRIEQNPWDQPVDWIVTETDQIQNERARDWVKARRACPQRVE